MNEPENTLSDSSQPETEAQESATAPDSEPEGSTEAAEGEAKADSAEADAPKKPIQEEKPVGPVIPETIGDNAVTLRQLIDAGVHFGHQTNRWNPRMAPFIYGARNGIHIINLDYSIKAFRKAYSFVVQAVSRGGHVLFVGTKRQAQEVIYEEAVRAEQFYITGRWLGGTLTNFRTMKISIDRLRSLERMEEEGVLETLSKKEAMGLRREKDRLEKFLGGIKEMAGPPAVLFLIDPNTEHIAVKEGNKLEIPIVALTDTNCNPDPIDFVIPGNDDAIRSIKLITSCIADACIEGRKRRRDYLQSDRKGADASEGVSIEFARSRRDDANFVYSATPTDDSSTGEGVVGQEFED